MKILIAVTSHLSYRLVEGQINYLSSLGYEVYFSSTYNEKVKRAIEKEGGIFCPLDIEREINPVKDLKSLLSTYKLLKNIRPDIINVSTPKASLIFSLVSFFYKNYKLIFTLRGLRSDTLQGLKHRIVKLTEQICCYKADRIIVISPSLESHAVSQKILDKSKSIVIGKGSSNGINLQRFSLQEEMKEFAKKFRQEYNIGSTDIVFGYVGRIVRDKGIYELHTAFTQLRKEYSNIKLLVVGEFEDGDALDKGVADSIQNDEDVIILNYSDKIEYIYPVMDSLVLYSYREGFGNVSIEAAAMGLPVIVSDIPGLKDTIKENETGLIAKPKDIDDLSSKMRVLINNPVLREEMGTKGRFRIEQFFDRKYIWSQQDKIYQKLLKAD